MNKLLILSIAVFTLFSCSSDDENIEKDPIIGTWKLEKATTLDNGQIVDETNECTKKSTVVFFENNITTSELFGGTNASNCISDGIDKGTWENTGNNIYEVIEDGETTPYKLPITFFDNNTKITLGSTVYKKQ